MGLERGYMTKDDVVDDVVDTSEPITIRDGEIEAYKEQIQKLEGDLVKERNRIEDLIKENTKLTLRVSAEHEVSDDSLFGSFDKYRKEK